ncbi:MAG: esterase, partial [Sphaerospermopsis sp. SIO1G2]|nr:esterase [Sphaerospermopsis sp. SIO1G2]
YLPNLEGEELERVAKNCQLTIVCGEGTWDEQSLDEAHRLDKQLSEKEINHELDLWGYDVTPDWYWWRKQVVHHFTKTLAK